MDIDACVPIIHPERHRQGSCKNPTLLPHQRTDDMITCHVKYIIDPYQMDAFERYSRDWIRIVRRLGGEHHGYFLPAEGANNIAYCLFSFANLSDYERYRREAAEDQECIELVSKATQQKFILSYERSFLRPLLQ